MLLTLVSKKNETLKMETAEYWNDLYLNQQTAWDIGYISTPLKEYIDQLKDRNQSILVPGCGNGYELEYLLQKGFANCTAIDIAPALTKVLADKLSRWNTKELTIITGNFFEMTGQFDLVLEQTFFCTLEPSGRIDYANKMHTLLKSSGKIAGVLFDRNFESGPPFGGTKAEYIEIFKPLFAIQKMEACYNSIEPRKGTELFILLNKKTG
jgi:SAM-dependent methyltransferase